MSLDIQQLAAGMLDALRDALKKQWPQVRNYAEKESTKLAETLGTIISMRVKGEITKEQAMLELDMQKHATRAVLLTVEGLELLAAEKAINAALDSVKQVVNTAIGFALL